MEAGIVGLPNVGKSTLFNALTSSQGAAAANYPFCTIEPNEGMVSVPDDRLQRMGGGRVNPETFTHGSSADRARWFTRGFESGDASQCDTFASVRQ